MSYGDSTNMSGSTEVLLAEPPVGSEGNRKASEPHSKRIQECATYALAFQILWSNPGGIPASAGQSPRTRTDQSYWAAEELISLPSSGMRTERGRAKPGSGRPSAGLSGGQEGGLSEALKAELFLDSVLIAAELAAKLRELLNLEQGWDGEDAQPVRVDALARAVLMLKNLKEELHSALVSPFVAPLFNGFVLLDWTSPRRTLEVEAEAKGWSVVGTLTSASGAKEYFSGRFEQDGAGVLKYYKWFQGGELLWPTE
jgi:hypothetical protein